MIEAKQINHIGIAVRSIADHQAYYEKTLGAKFEGLESVPAQRVNVAFFRVGEVRLELLEPTDAEGPVAQFLQKRGEGIHHVAYTVERLAERLAELGAAGVRLIDAAPRAGAHGMEIAFLHPASTGGVLTELCEPADRSARCAGPGGEATCR